MQTFTQSWCFIKEEDKSHRRTPNTYSLKNTEPFRHISKDRLWGKYWHPRESRGPSRTHSEFFILTRTHTCAEGVLPSCEEQDCSSPTSGASERKQQASGWMPSADSVAWTLCGWVSTGLLCFLSLHRALSLSRSPSLSLCYWSCRLMSNFVTLILKVGCYETFLPSQNQICCQLVSVLVVHERIVLHITCGRRIAPHVAACRNLNVRGGDVASYTL